MGSLPSFQDQKAFISNSLFCAFFSSSSECILETLSLKTLKPISFHSSILEHVFFVREVFKSVFWSKMERRKPNLVFLHRAAHHRRHFVNKYGHTLTPPLIVYRNGVTSNHHYTSWYDYIPWGKNWVSRTCFARALRHLQVHEVRFQYNS